MILYSIKRIGYVLIGLLVVSILIFTISEVIPGDVAQVILGPTANPESLARIRNMLELDRPAIERYRKWLWRSLHGDFGMSLTMPGVSINSLIARRLPNSLALAILATIIVVPFSLTLGTIAGLSKNRTSDHIIDIVSLFAISTPEFISGILLMLFFSLVFPILPSSSILNPDKGLIQQISSFILPAISLSFLLSGYVTRMTRASVIDVVESPYITTAVLKGLPKYYIVLNHILRNALLPSITVISMNFGWVLGGAVIIESVFSFPGLGRLLYSSITARDIPVVQAIIILATAGYFIANLCADLLYVLLDPRIKYGRSEE